MNRRNFIKTIAKTMAAACAVLVLGLPKVEEKPKMAGRSTRVEISTDDNEWAEISGTRIEPGFPDDTFPVTATYLELPELVDYWPMLNKETTFTVTYK